MAWINPKINWTGNNDERFNVDPDYLRIKGNIEYLAALCTKYYRNPNGETPYTHTAWSWSSDGVDRFTNAYPTENLFSMNLISVDSKMQPGTLTTPGGWAVTFISHEQLTKMLKPGKTYSVHYGFELLSRATGTTPFNQPSHGTLLLYSSTSGYPSVELGGTLNNVADAQTWVIGTKRVRDKNFVTPANLYDEAANYRIIYYTMWSKNSDGTSNFLEKGRFYDVKFSEIDSLASQFPIYTPSPTDDPINAYPSYRGEYTDYTQADSTNYADYTWSLLNGNEVDKSDTDVGIPGTPEGKHIIPLQTADLTTIPYVSFFNNITADVDLIADVIGRTADNEDMRVIYENQPVWNYNDLNIIESNTLWEYNKIVPQYQVSRKVPFEQCGLGGMF